jgi:hypothetical protein
MMPMRHGGSRETVLPAFRIVPRCVSKVCCRGRILVTDVGGVVLGAYVHNGHGASPTHLAQHNVGCPLQTDRIWVVTLLDTWGRPHNRLNACFLLSIVVGREIRLLR